MSKLSEGKIFQLSFVNSDDVIIGSTMSALKTRLSAMKTNYKNLIIRGLKLKYPYDVIDKNNINEMSIELIDSYKNCTKSQLNAYERDMFEGQLTNELAKVEYDERLLLKMNEEEYAEHKNARFEVYKAQVNKDKKTKEDEEKLKEEQIIEDEDIIEVSIDNEEKNILFFTEGEHRNNNIMKCVPDAKDFKDSKVYAKYRSHLNEDGYSMLWFSRFNSELQKNNR